jgi:hypothetical protein
VRRDWTVVAVSLLVLGLQACSASPPEQVPVASPVANDQPPPPAVSAPAAGGVAAADPAPAGQPTPAASAAAPQATASASASPSPSPDPAEAARAEQEKRIRAELATAKAKVDSLTAKADTECPDLKPGQLRHPGAVSHCAQLRSDAAQAVSDYEALKKEARDAGIAVP